MKRSPTAMFKYFRIGLRVKMFTGIINHCGKVSHVKTKADAGVVLTIATEYTDLELGESIAVDGICLTVTAIDQHTFNCDLSPETLNFTTAKDFTINKLVNLERALRLSDRLGGHIVTGHVDECAILQAKNWVTEFIELRFKCSSHEAQQYLIKKGSVAINGVSLTLNSVYPDGFDVMVIPHTLAMTNLDSLKVADSVNIEYDWMAKLLVKQFQLMSIKS